jgi:hypothetical protein
MTKNTKNTQIEKVTPDSNVAILKLFTKANENARDSFYKLASYGLAHLLNNQGKESQAIKELTQMLQNSYESDALWKKAKGAEYRKIRYIKKVYEMRIDLLKNIYTIDSTDTTQIANYLKSENLTQALVLAKESPNPEKEKDSKVTPDSSEEKQEEKESITTDARIKRILDDITEVKKNSQAWIALRDALVARFNLSLQSDNGLKDLYKAKKAA